ncbi:MAG: hypothetical protein IKM24_09175 [Clostridia bacterium]|nr:hypothetical protein [Clostridia bacterium]
MASQIGFLVPQDTPDLHFDQTSYTRQRTDAPRNSIVRVYFEERDLTLSYYNNRFDLYCGDYVFVEGKLDGVQGRVVEVNYNFKIKSSDYMRVIAVADTDVRGQFYFAGSHFVAFQPSVLPAEKVKTWFMPACDGDEEVISSYDDTSFLLENLNEWNVSTAVAKHGKEYYMANKVEYLCLNGTKGYALVQGSHMYEVEFTYEDGAVSRLTCSCYCCSHCKHETAALLQLRETLEQIGEHYGEVYKQTGYFAAVSRTALFTYAVDTKEAGCFTL